MSYSVSAVFDANIITVSGSKWYVNGVNPLSAVINFSDKCVRLYGATPTGNPSNINTDISNSSSGDVFMFYSNIAFPSVNGPVNINKPLTFLGISGQPATLTFTGFNNKDINVTSGNVTFQNLIIDNTTSTNGIDVPFKVVSSNKSRLSNITLSNVEFKNLSRRGVDIYNCSNVLLDGVTLSSGVITSSGAVISLTGCVSATVKNSVIARSVNGSFGSIGIYAINGPCNISGWSSMNDATRLTGITPSNINLQSNNTFLRSAYNGAPTIVLDFTLTGNPNTAINGSQLNPSMSYGKDASSSLVVPSNWYAFANPDSNVLGGTGRVTTTVTFTSSSNFLDINPAVVSTSAVLFAGFATYQVDPTKYQVFEISSGLRVGTSLFPLSISTGTASDVLSQYTNANAPATVYVSDLSSNVISVPTVLYTNISNLSDATLVVAKTSVSTDAPKFAVFTSGDVGAAVKRANDNKAGSVVVQTTVSGSTKSILADITKRSVRSDAYASNASSSDVSMNITSLPSTHSVVLNIEDPDATPNAKANMYFKVVDGSGVIVSNGYSIPATFTLSNVTGLSNIDVYRYDGSNYVKQGTATNITSNKFSYTFTSNSVYQLRQQVGGGAGDPYIKTLAGDLYKLPSFNGFLRLYQGTVDGKMLTINAQTRIDDDVHGMDADTLALNKKLTNPVEENKLRMKSAMSFFERVYIHYNDKEMIVNIMDGFCVEKDGFSVQNVGNIQKYLSGWKIYEHLSGNIYNIEITPDVFVRVGIIPIKSIRNSVEIFGVDSRGNGAIVNKLSAKAMSLKKLSDKKEIERKDNSIKRYIPEVFVCNEKKQAINIPYMG